MIINLFNKQCIDLRFMIKSFFLSFFILVPLKIIPVAILLTDVAGGLITSSDNSLDFHAIILLLLLCLGVLKT